MGRRRFLTSPLLKSYYRQWESQTDVRFGEIYIDFEADETIVGQPEEAQPLGTDRASGEWLSLAHACRFLGVNASSLRRWADNGRVRSFRTPGGHRRFSELDLRRLLERPPERPRPPVDYHSLGNLAVARIRRRLQRGRGHESAWYSTVGEQDRLRFRPLGRRLLSLAEECLRKRSRRGRLIEEARAIGREYGEELARGGVSLPDAVEAFTFFRRSLDETTHQLAQRENLSVEDAADAWEQVTGLADVVLVTMVGAFDQRRGTKAT